MKKITRIDISCNNCGLPKFNCICKEIDNFKTISKYYLLTSEKEVDRPSNTGRLLKLANNENTEIIIWKRKEIDRKIEEIICNDNTYLVFPSLYEEDKLREIILDCNSNFLVNKHCNFIIVDSTWQEAKKIVRKSEYLKELPLLNINLDKSTEFTLRRGNLEGTMCTLEVIIELMKLNNDVELAKKTSELLNLFIESYNAGRSGHKVK